MAVARSAGYYRLTMRLDDDDGEVFFGKAINTCGPRSAITAPEDELGVAIVSVILFFMSPMAFRASAVATLPL